MSAMSASDHARTSHNAQHTHPSHMDTKNPPANNPIKNLHRKNSFCNTSNDNLGNFVTQNYGSNSNYVKRHPQPLQLRKDLVTYSDGTYYAESLSTTSSPAPVSLPPSLSSPSSSTPSFTTAFSNSAFATSLLSNQRMGTLVLPDLVILTNEIPWSSVASEFAILTADDIAFDLFGEYYFFFRFFFFFLSSLSLHFFHLLSFLGLAPSILLFLFSSITAILFSKHFFPIPPPSFLSLLFPLTAPFTYTALHAPLTHSFSHSYQAMKSNLPTTWTVTTRDGAA
jgi:hypothetical protein